MTLVGLVGPVAVQGGLSIRDAMAASMAAEAPLVEPLDVAAISAELDQAQTSMDAARTAAVSEVERLDRLAARRR